MRYARKALEHVHTLWGHPVHLETIVDDESTVLPYNPLHSHGSRLKNVIISGVWYTGATDSASAKDFGPGSIVIMPANWVHVSGCRAGSDCVFYQEGKGKFDFKAAAEMNRRQ
jgi:hypothetical protein